MKNKLKKTLVSITPKKVYYYYAMLKALQVYLYDIERVVHNKLYHGASENSLKGRLSIYYHSIEKGLTMPSTRPRFGKAVIDNLVGLLEQYRIKQYDRTSLEYVQSVSVLREYIEFHERINVTLEEDVSRAIKAFLDKEDERAGCQQKHFSRDEFFALVASSYDKFCMSRYSVRNFADQEIPVSVLNDCIGLAQKSPSFCNRQPTRVNIVKNHDLKRDILSLQNGNRGFGHLADTLLVITSDLSVIAGLNERHESYINSGIFTMALVHALHFNKVGACVLNWSVTKDKDLALRKLLNIPECEVAILIIACGYVPDEFDVASSPRKPTAEITRIFA